MYGLNEEQTAKQLARMAAARQTIAEQQLDPAGRDAFFVRRSCGLGGSDMSAVLGINPYKSAYSLWCEKTGLTDNSSFTNLATEFGRWNEEFVAQQYAKNTHQIVGNYRPYSLPQVPYLISNYDRVVYADETKKEIVGGLEIKTCAVNSEVLRPGEKLLSKKWGRGNEYDAAGRLLSTDDRIDPLYYPQVQFYLYTSGLPWWDVSVLIGGREIRTFRVLPDRVYHTKMIQAAVAFWVRVLDHNPPPMVFTDAAQIKDTEPAAEASPELIELCAQYKQTNSQIKALEQQLNGLKDKIAGQMGTVEKMTCQKDGKTKSLCTFKAQRRVSFDSKTLALEHPDIFDQYTHEISTARILRVN